MKSVIRMEMTELILINHVINYWCVIVLAGLFGAEEALRAAYRLGHLLLPPRQLFADGLHRKHMKIGSAAIFRQHFTATAL